MNGFEASFQRNVKNSRIYGFLSKAVFFKTAIVLELVCFTALVLGYERLLWSCLASDRPSTKAGRV